MFLAAVRRADPHPAWTNAWSETGWPRADHRNRASGRRSRRRQSRAHRLLSLCSMMPSLLDLCPPLSSAPDTGQGLADAALESARLGPCWDCDRAVNGRSAPDNHGDPGHHLSSSVPLFQRASHATVTSRFALARRRSPRSPRGPVEPYATVRNRPFLRQPPLPRRQGR